MSSGARRSLALAAAAAVAALSLVSCGNGRDTARSPRLVVPEVQTGGADAGGSQPVAVAPEPAITAKVPLGDNEKPLAIYEFNLDLELTDEQILVTRQVGTPDAPIMVSVVAYDSVAQTYRRTWEDVVKATDERYVRVTILDVVGDHSYSIIVRGATQDSPSTMDIFRRTISAGTALAYTPIFSLVSRGAIDIPQDPPRSQAYYAGDTDGRPYPIVVTEPDKEGGTSPDIIKVTYQWSTRDRRYVATAPQRIQGETVERERLAALFSSDSPKAYLEFLEGSWISSSEDGSDQGLLSFSPDTRTFQIYSVDNSIEEEYRWERADAYYRNVTIRGASNTILRDITKDVQISVESLDEIQVTMVSTIDNLDRWRATYHRANEAALVAQLSEPRNDSLPQPAGVYESTAGEQIVFEAPRFTWISPTGTLTGGFYLYALGRVDRPVLGMLVQKGYGERAEERAYIVEQSTLVETDRVVKTMVLQPAELTVYGARAVSDERLAFVQVQVSTEPQTTR